MAMLWPGPKSTASWPGTPRKAVRTRRWRRSPTGGLLEEPAQGLRAVALLRRHGVAQGLGQRGRKALDLPQDGLQEFTLDGGLHGRFHSRGRARGCQHTTRAA